MILNSIFDKKISPEKKCHFVFLKIVENEKFTFRRQKWKYTNTCSPKSTKNVKEKIRLHKEHFGLYWTKNKRQKLKRVSRDVEGWMGGV